MTEFSASSAWLKVRSHWFGILFSYAYADYRCVRNTSEKIVIVTWRTSPSAAGRKC